MICSRSTKFEELISRSGSHSHAFENRGLWINGLKAMSAGNPVLVSRNSGFGEALRSAAFDSTFVTESEDPAVWTAAIQNIWSKDREMST